MEHLIESVRKYPCLWQIDSPEYKDNELKEAAWLEVFNECDFPSVAEMKSLWKKLRDGHRQAINAKKKTTTGQAADHKYKWKYERHMEFLLPFIKNRTTHTNIKRTEHPDDSLTSEDSRDSSSQVTKRNKTIHFKLDDEQRKREKRHEARDLILKKIIEDTPKTENKPTAMENFFISICDTTSQLPEDLQISVQRKLFNIVMEAKELNLMRSNRSNSSSGSIIHNFTGGTPFQLQRTSPFYSAKSPFVSSAQNYNSPETQDAQYARRINPVQRFTRPRSAISSYTSSDIPYSPEALQTAPTPHSRHYEDCSQTVDATVRQYTDAPVEYSTRNDKLAGCGNGSSSFITPGPVHSPERMTSPPRQQPPQQSTRPHSTSSSYTSPVPVYSPEPSPLQQQTPQADSDIRAFLEDFSY